MQRMVIDQLTEPDAAWGAPAALSGSTVQDRATLVDDMRYRNLMKFGRIVPDICSAGKSRFLGFRVFLRDSPNNLKSGKVQNLGF